MRILNLMQWAILLIVLALVFIAGYGNHTAAAATPDPPPEHWVPGKGDQGWQWKWRVWLPDKWRRVGHCETQLNWSHANSRYVSAFGIYRPQYNKDAAYMSSVPWNDRVPPSPWHQYRAALGHYRQFGGFSGWGCRNA